MAKGKRQRPQPAAARELVALGTGSQVPTRHRNHNGYLLRWDDKGILFDPGEGTQRQMIYAGVTTSQIHTVLITHFHGDHCLGLAGLHQRISLDRVPHTVSIHYPKSGERFYKRLRYASIYHEAADINPCPIAGPGVIDRGPPLEITALKLDHGVDTFGYRLVEPDGVTMLPEKLKERGLRGPIIKQLINEGEVTNDAGERVKLSEVSVHRPGQKMAFVMDTRLCDNAFELAKDVDMLVCESTYLRTETREARDHGHLTALQAARIAKESNARLLVLTHFSQRYPSNRPFVEEANELHPNVVAVRDTDRVAMPKRIKVEPS